MSAYASADEAALRALLPDRAVDDYPLLCSAALFEPKLAEELALLVLRAYQAGKEVGARR